MNLDNTYSFEIDFLPVGDGERSGDAIAMRWQQPDGYCIAVIDGGTKESGEHIVEHVRTVYGARLINLVINTHPDQDHASGLSVVLEKMPVQGFWMHRPWAYPNEIKHLFANGRFTTAGLSGRIKDALDSAYRLEELAVSKGVPIVEPFQGQWAGPLLVLSPPRDAYLQLIPHFANTPEAKYPMPGFLSGIVQAAMTGAAAMAESWGVETLREDGTTSAQNETSVVLYGRFNGIGILLTGDAGQQALCNAALYAYSQGIRLDQCWVYQVPHHGSRRNVSPTVLNGILGHRKPVPQEPTRFAVVSVSAGCTTHPRKAVANAFRRRGVAVVVTKGALRQFYSGYPPRAGYGVHPILPLFGTVEGYD